MSRSRRPTPKHENMGKVIAKAITRGAARADARRRMHEVKLAPETAEDMAFPRWKDAEDIWNHY